MPGGLNVRRRAKRLAKKLGESGSGDPLAPMDWVNVYAMAVNEENAAGGRVVTAPTNGAAGIIPALRCEILIRILSAAMCTLAFALLSLVDPSTAFAQDAVLSGTVVTPDKVIPSGWVVVKNGHIVAIRESAPDDAQKPRVETNGIIFPGFVDLHDHPMYNIFERWTPKTKFKPRRGPPGHTAV